ncbi:haloacid dehalogenase type II [Halobacillus seohaensis]|uniref:Haloacid dehalogenase type II n=1 Tax=Halobacillus seohaensis TaxID=447421 RepID=A0ABW2EUJ6_9BACI
MNYKAYVFDAYGTLFNVHSVIEAIHEFFPEKGPQISEKWRSSQVHYFLIRQLIDDYVPFETITRSALQDALAYYNAKGNDETIDYLMKQYEKLKPYEEVHFLKKQHPDKELTIFSNGTRSMLEPLLENNQLTSSFSLLTADDVNVYKPHPKAYKYAQEKLQIDQDDILFFSSNPWDIAGATQYGFHTAWVNRQNLKWPELGVKPTHTIPDLSEIPSKP